MKRWSAVVIVATGLVACSSSEPKPDPKPAEAPEYRPLSNLPEGTRAVVRVDPNRTEALQAGLMARFDGGAPMPANVDVGLAATSGALLFPPQPTRIFGASDGRDPLPSLDRERPIFHALTTDPAIAFVDAMRVGKLPVAEPSLGARLYLPATNADALAKEFGYFCEDGRNAPMTDGCKTVAGTSVENGWVVVELDYGTQPARTRTSGSTTFSRQTPAVKALVDTEAAVSIWIEAAAVAEIGAVMSWYDVGIVEGGGEPRAAAERRLEAMAPLLRSDPGARETEDVTLSLSLEGQRDLAIDVVRTLTKRGASRVEVGESAVAARSFDIKDPIVRGELPWSMARIRTETEPPAWAYDEAEIGRFGSNFWRQATAWLEAPFAYYVGLAWGPRPSRAAGWLRVFYALDGARVRLDARQDPSSPIGLSLHGGVAVVTMGDGSRGAVANVIEGLIAQVAATVSAAYDFDSRTEGERTDVFATVGKARAIAAADPSPVVFFADLDRAATLLAESGNAELFGPQLVAIFRAAGAVALTRDRDGLAESWRLHVGTESIPPAQAVATDATPLMLGPIDPCVIEARRAAGSKLKEATRGERPGPVDYSDIAARCATDEGRRLVGLGPEL